MTYRMKETALRYLNKDILNHIDLIDPIQRDSAEILYATEKGVMIKELKNNAIMLCVDSIEVGNACLELINTTDLVCLHQDFMIEAFKNKFRLNDSMTCFQAVYLNKDKLLLDFNVELKLLDISYLDFVKEHYDAIDDEKYLNARIENQEMIGAFKDDQIVGFIGIHAEETMGMLEVLPEYRKMGIATQLEGALINHLLEIDRIPYCQVEIENEKSLKLQNKLGLMISKEQIIWLFKVNV